MENEKEGTSLEKQIPVILSNGLNKIRVSCTNNHGVESYKEELNIIYNGDSVKPDLYLLVTSVSQYANKALDLNYSVKDGQDVTTLMKSNRALYDKVIIDTIFNNDVSRENFKKLKDQLYNSDVNDHIILFMSGHGTLDESFNFNFATYNIDLSTPSKNGISFDMIESLMDSIPARKKLVLIDACHSGELDKEEIREKTQAVMSDLGIDAKLKEQSFSKVSMKVYKLYGISNTSVELMEQLFTNMSYGSGTVVISAAAGNSYALESKKWDNGVFTFCILEGLKDKKADTNSDGVVTVTELEDFVVDRVYRLTNGRQKPTCRKENLEFDFPVWK